MKPKSTAPEADDDPAFTQPLLDWFACEGRHDLPWQKSPTPYRVWISEIMLQQTQVETVRPYFERWMQRFPDVESLAAASADEVMHLWSGLGYYARARNAQRAAQIICEQFGGRFPETLEGVMALPGIGRSTAGAILALAMDQHHAILDGNVKRVLTRFYAIAGWPGKRSVEKKLWALAEQHTPKSQVASYTQAVMDLGATVCTRARPKCEQCPVSAGCMARQMGAPTKFPEAKPKKSRSAKTTVMAMFVNANGRVLLQQRPPAGIWGGLWSLPEFDTTTDLDDHLQSCHGIDAQIETWLPVKHGFTHFELQITPAIVSISAPDVSVAADREERWIDPASPPAMGLAAPVARLLKQLAKQG